MPLQLTEPRHPRLHQYEHEHTKRWSEIVAADSMSGGLRAVQAVKVTLSSLKVVPINEAVVIPFVAQQVKDGVFTPKDIQTEAAAVMLNELARWAEALRPLRG